METTRSQRMPFDTTSFPVIELGIMSNPSLSEIISLPSVLRSPSPKKTVGEGLVNLLKRRLKELDIIWNPKSFSAGLSNPALPRELLVKLENLLILAEQSEWRISNSLRFELDETVEEIETFNPASRKELAKERKAALRDFRAGRVVSGEEIERRFGVNPR